MIPNDSTSDGRDATSRRTFLKAVGAGTAVTAIGSSAATATTPLDAQFRQVRNVTKKYEDPQKAIDDGYLLMGPYVPGMGWHFLNPEFVGQTVENDFDIKRPELLTYGDAGDGFENLTLASVEYAIPMGAREYTTENPPDLFEDTDGSEKWHAHPSAEHALTMPFEAGHHGLPEDFPESPADVSLDDQIRSSNWLELSPGGEPDSPMLEHGTAVMANFAGGNTMDARAVVGSSVHPDLLTLHTWVHEENADGTFAPLNPDLANSPAE